VALPEGRRHRSLREPALPLIPFAFRIAEPSLGWDDLPFCNRVALDRRRVRSGEAEEVNMKSVLLVVVGIVAGAVAALFLASGFIVGVGAGTGIVTGLKAGACLTVEAAKQRGFITAEQVNEVLVLAGRQIASSADLGEQALIAGGDAECAKVVADLKKSAQK
jgi:hypothetical protein